MQICKDETGDERIPPVSSVAKNRRFAKLHQLMSKSDYFEEEEIKHRCPLIYHMFIGRYSNRNSLVRSISKPSDIQKFLFQRIDKGEYEASLQDAYKKYVDRNGHCFFEQEPLEAMETDKEGNVLSLSEQEMDSNVDELIRVMHSRFLEGYDVQFVNYNSIDNDQSLDQFNAKEAERDQEEKYFDSLEQNTHSPPTNETSVYTGILDY